MILTSLIAIPFSIAITFIFLSDQRARQVALVSSFAYFVMSLSLFYFFDPSIEHVQLVEKLNWFPYFGIYYFLGIDGISFWMVLLTSLLFPLTILGSVSSVQEKIKPYLACLFILTGLIQGSFLALDAVLFYIFFESSLLPLFFLILIWGGEERTYAAFKFFIYTAFGSLFMLAGIALLMFMARSQLGYFSASLLDFYKLNIPFIGNHFLNPQSILFIAFLLAFAIKVPIFPLHTWLPLAHVQAPTAGSMYLAAIVLKMGAYGFLRFIFPLFPEASVFYSPYICFIASLGIIYGALMALAQEDMKKLVAFSSVSHMGYVILGFFVFNSYSLAGGYYQMITHGLSSAALFALVGFLYERTHTKKISLYGGVASKAPIYSTLFFLVTLSAIALPLTGGFISEFLILFGVFQAEIKWIPLAICGVVLGASYMLYLVLRVFFGSESRLNSKIFDLNYKEMIVVIPFVILIFITGLFPNFIFKYSQKSLTHLIENQFNYELNEVSKSNDSEVKR